MIKIQCRFFASIREALQCSVEFLELPDEVNTVHALRDYLQMRGGQWEAALGGDRVVRMAVDQQMADADAVLYDGAEVAFFPPVTGG